VNGSRGPDTHCARTMIDPLFGRAQLAIEESRALQDRRRALQAEYDIERGQLRLAVFECAMCRSESKARRDDRE